MPPRDRQRLLDRLHAEFDWLIDTAEFNWLVRQLENEADPTLNYIAAAVAGGDDEWGDLLEVAKATLRAEHAAARSRSRLRSQANAQSERDGGSESRLVFGETREGLLKVLSSEEDRRALAFSEAIASQAGRIRDVARFRRTVLGGPLLTEDQAHAFLGSIALGVLSIELLQEGGIPVVGHQIHSIRALQDGVHLRHVEFWIDPPGATVERELEGSDKYPLNADLEWWGTEVWPGSVLDWLRALSDNLARHCKWSETEAAWFVLTGLPPFASPLRLIARLIEHDRVPNHVRYRRGQITLEVDAWVSAQTVLVAYREAQRLILAGEQGNAVRNRLPSARTLDVFLFAEHERDESGKLPPKRELARRWNEAHPDRRFADLDKFGRAHDVAEREILGTRVGLASVAGSDSKDVKKAGGLFIRRAR